jgi:hypothetical protein
MPDKLGQFYVISLNRGMPESEEKMVSMVTLAAEPEKTRKRRVKRNKTQRSVDKTDVKGEAIIKTEEVILTQNATIPKSAPKGIKVETQQVFKLVPKIIPSQQKTVPPKTKITIMPKTKKVQKITIIGKPVKKEIPAVVTTTVKPKISLPASKKTRKQYKERQLRIEL